MARPRKNANVDRAAADEVAEAARLAAQEAREAHLAAVQEVAVKTMTGDLRDHILTILRFEQDKRRWDQRSEVEQRHTVSNIEATIQHLVRNAVELIAASGLPTIKATLDQIVVKEGLKLVLNMPKSHEQRLQIMDAVGGTVLLVVADASEFMGERAPVQITPDQADIEDVLVEHSTDERVSAAFVGPANGAAASPLN